VAKYRKKNSVVEATQWWKYGDHPKDGFVGLCNGIPPSTIEEGMLVHRWSPNGESSDRACDTCGQKMLRHGWIQMFIRVLVCPGDWIVTEDNGEYWTYRPDHFNKSFDLVKD